MNPGRVPYIVKASCTDKIGLTEEAANCIVDKKLKENVLWYYYPCKLCGKFHMTSSEPKPQLELRVI